MVSKRQFILGLVLASVLGGVIVLVGLSFFTVDDSSSSVAYSGDRPLQPSIADVNTTPKNYIVPEGINFIKASRAIVPAVVHITNISSVSGRSRSWSRLFGRSRRIQQSTGSGVIISPDGYIATNYHVVEDADELEVRLDDNRRISAELVGVDPDTDLALIKIDVENLPNVGFGDSDQVEIGEWVLAVGNPFDLNNTVTAGIVSAKARNINLIGGRQNRYGIESFIQTDAVVNRGNSGGALVNLDGELIGINTAIATNTGTFNGYSFAVPSILVKKVMDDLLEYGEVQRGLLGIEIRDADGRFTKELSGIYVSGVNPGGAADEAGLEEEDVIVGIDDRKVRTTSELQEFVARKRPGDEIKVTYMRRGKEENTQLVLMKKEIIASLSPEEIQLTYSIEGAIFSEVPSTIQRQLRIDGGVQIVELGDGAWEESGLEEGFVITKVGDQDINGLEDFQALLDSKERDFYVLGKSKDGKKDYFKIDW